MGDLFRLPRILQAMDFGEFGLAFG